MDQPVGTGYSYAASNASIPTEEIGMASHLYAALQVVAGSWAVGAVDQLAGGGRGCAVGVRPWLRASRFCVRACVLACVRACAVRVCGGGGGEGGVSMPVAAAAMYATGAHCPAHVVDPGPPHPPPPAALPRRMFLG